MLIGDTLLIQFGGASLYVVAALAYLLYLALPNPRVALFATGSLLFGVVGHIACFLIRAVGDTLPLTSTSVALSIVALAVALVWLVAQYYTGAVILGAFVAPVAAVFAVLASAAGTHTPITGSSTPFGLLGVHLGSVTLGTGLLALAAGGGVVYLIQERMLKRKKMGAMFRRLPALDVLDRVVHRSQTAGFVLLTIAFVTGAIMAAAVGQAHMFHSNPEVVATVILWGWYSAALQTRWFAGWRGRKAAWFAVSGFVALVFSFASIRFWLSVVG